MQNSAAAAGATNYLIQSQRTVVQWNSKDWYTSLVQSVSF